MYKRYVHLIRKYADVDFAQLALIIFLAILCAGFEMVNIGALVPLLQLIESPDAPGGYLWDFLEVSLSFFGLPLNLNMLLFLITLCFLIGQVLLYLKKRLQIDIQTNVAQTLKNKIFESAVHTDISYYHNHNSSHFVNSIIKESEYSAAGIFSIIELISDILLILVYAFLLLYISTEMTLICLVISFIGIYSTNMFLTRSTIYAKKIVENNTLQNSFVNERLNLIRLIKTSSTELLECRKLFDITYKYRKDYSQYMINGIKIEIIFQIIIFCVAILILFVSINLIKIPFASLLVFLFILVRITSPLRDLNSRRHEIVRNFSSFNRIDEILEETTPFKKIANGRIPFRGFQDSLDLNGICFSYNNENPILKDVSFTIHKNEFIALVGASGGGKSTLIDIIVRMINPITGKVTIDNVDIRDLDIELYHSKIGLVSQDILIFNDTVVANICYGHPIYEMPRVIDAAKIAYAHDFISDLPEGYDTVLGERGLKLSGGQKQRIALARAIYKNPELLILDEATSALDNESERIIQDAINNIKKKYTIIAIAHRLSTIENADRIIIIEKGKIVEEGTHEQLLSTGGFYSKYYTLQFTNGSKENH